MKIGREIKREGEKRIGEREKERMCVTVGLWLLLLFYNVTQPTMFDIYLLTK